MKTDEQKRQGRFFTPEWAVKDAHRRLGIDQGIPDDAFVFDPCGGIGNLYAGLVGAVVASTLVQEEADEAARLTGHTTYQGDFLTAELHPAVLDKLEQYAREGRRIIILVNPPYATSSEAGTTPGKHKAGVADTNVRKAMHEDKLGKASQQLYAQFMYGTLELVQQLGFTRYTLAVFSKATFLTSQTFKPLRQYLFSKIKFQEGWLCQASDFHPALSSRWGILFSIWQQGTTTQDVSVDVLTKGGELFNEYEPPSYLARQNTYTSYQQWNNDAVVYALLHGKNNCTAMRNVEYKGRIWAIDNHFFWRTRQDALEVLQEYPAMLQDALESTHEPYAATLFQQGLELSEEAADVMQALDDLYVLSLPARTQYALDNPAKHLLAWDAGVYQLKYLWREHYPAQFKHLGILFKRLASKMQPGVYAYGFLK